MPNHHMLDRGTVFAQYRGAMSSLPNTPPATTDPDRAARAALARNRALATSLLLAMLGLVIGSYFMPPFSWVPLLQAASKAGFIGGIADWFAITALFRHPLGLPIPHTAIIPREKQRLGEALGRFVSRHVVTGPEIDRVMAEINMAGLLRDVLTDDRVVKQLAAALAQYLPRLLRAIEDGRAKRTLARLLPRLMGGRQGGQIAVRGLRAMTDSGRHQLVLEFVLEKLRAAMLAREADLRDAIAARVREQGGRLVGWTLGATIAKRILGAVNAELDRMDPRSSALREAFDEWVRHEIDAMEQNPGRLAELGATLSRLLSHPSVQDYGGDLWARLRRSLEADAAKPDGRSRSAIENTVRDLGRMISEDPAIASNIQKGAASMVRGMLPVLQDRLAEFIGTVVGNWDSATITEKLELRIGRDLQYVRINGTLVGFFVGGLSFLVLKAVFGLG
jgi:uncharacterized membrane-anchored protein YjiN (DUF445 family)